jgi:RND family efflux transporter MFP subunit
MKQFNKKTKILALVGLAILIVLIVVLVKLATGKSEAEKSGQKTQIPALTVTVAQPSKAQLPITLVANGNIAAWQEAIIGSESNGLQLTDVLVNVGDKVHRGQVLAKFAVATTKAEVMQARASLMEAEANAADAKNNAQRAKTLSNTGALSTQQINQYLTTAQTAQARVEAARASLQAQQVRLQQTTVLAPDDGVISARSATVGAVVGAGTELFRMIRKGRLEWRAEVTAAELGRIAIGTPVSVIATNGTQMEGRVRMIAPTVDLQNRTALVYVDLPKSVAGVSPARAGMFASGEFNLGMSDALMVPQQSVVVRDGFSYVFRLEPDHHVTRIKIVAGRRVKDMIEVVSGISDGAQLVASGTGFLNDGDLVKVVAAQAVENKTPASATDAKIAPATVRAE